MTTEINRNSLHTYRISPADPLLVERRENKHGARWEEVRRCQSRGQASSALRKLSKGGTLREETQEDRPVVEKPVKQTVNYYQQSKYAALRYDYRQVDEQHREQVQAAAVEIRTRERRAAEDLIEIGRRLISVKDVLAHGQFLKWIEDEFAYSDRLAREFMNIARRFGEDRRARADLNATVLRMLAAPSVPDEAIDAVIEAAQAQGKPLPVADVQRIIKPYRPRPKGPRQLPGPRPVGPLEPPTHTEATIEAEYVVMEPAPADPFESWLAACPANLTLRQRHDIIELAKRVAVDARGEEPKLYNAVTNALPMWSQLIITMEKMLK